MALDKELKIQLDEAHANGATTAELDVIVEEYNSQKKKDQPSLSFGESDLPSRDISLPAESQPEVQETEVESEVVVDPEPEPILAQPAPKWKDVLAEVYREKNFTPDRPNAFTGKGLTVEEKTQEASEKASNQGRGVVTDQNITDSDRYNLNLYNDDQEYVVNRTAFDKWRTSGGIAPSALSYLENFKDVMVHMGPEYIETLSGALTPSPQTSTALLTRAAREDAALKKIKAKADKMAEEGYYFDHKMDPLTAFGAGEGPGDAREAFAYAVETFAGTAPLIVAGALAPQASLPLMFAYGYGAFQADVVNEEWFQKLDPIERMAFGAAGGALEVLPEYVGSRILSRSLKKLAVGQIGEKAFRQATSKYAKGLALGAGLDVTTEAGTEAVTGFGQELLNQYASGQEIDINAAWEAAKTGALLGAVLGTAFTAPGAAADFVTTARSLGKDFSVYKADREIQKLKEVLKNPELTPEQIDVYNEQLRKAFDKKMEATNVSQAFYQRVGLESTEDLNELARLDLEARSILAKATNNSRYMGERENRTRVAIDKKLEGQYQQELKSIRAQQQEIQNRYVTPDAFDTEAPQSEAFTEAKEAGGGLTVDEFIEGNLTGAGRALASAAKNAETLLGDNVKVVMHDGTFDDTMDQVSSSGADRGSGEQGRMVVRNDNGQIEVHIETQRASPLTVAHETFHALFFDQFGQNAEVAQQMVDGLSRVMQGGSKADVALFNRVNDFVQGYEGSVAAEEFAAELFGELTATYRQLSQSGKSKFKNYIVSFIDDLLKTFGINVSSLANMRNEFKTDRDLINFMNSLSRAFQEGTADGAIEETLVVKDQLDTAATIEKDKKKTRKQDRSRTPPEEIAEIKRQVKVANVYINEYNKNIDSVLYDEPGELLVNSRGDEDLPVSSQEGYDRVVHLSEPIKIEGNKMILDARRVADSNYDQEEGVAQYVFDENPNLTRDGIPYNDLDRLERYKDPQERVIRFFIDGDYGERINDPKEFRLYEFDLSEQYGADLASDALSAILDGYTSLEYGDESQIAIDDAFEMSDRRSDGRVKLTPEAYDYKVAVGEKTANMSYGQQERSRKAPKKTKTSQKLMKELPPDATPDELARFEREATLRVAEQEKEKEETREREEGEEELRKEREQRDLAKAQREDDIRSGKLETLDGLENEQAAINKDMNGVLATMERSRKGTPRKAIQVQDETKYVKRSKSWKKMKAQSPDNFIGETIVTTPSDRMAVAKFVFDDGSTIELKGGYGYAKEVGLPWASSSLTALNKYLKPINKQIKEKGYAYLAPVAMSDASHSSNFQFLLTGLGEIRSALKTGSTTEAKVRTQLEAISGMKIGKKADGKDIFLNDLSSALAETNMDKVLDKLENIFSVENASFESRRNFMSRLLGPTDSDAKNPKAFIDGVISGAELVKRTTDPALIGVPRGYIPGLIKITELIKPYQTSQEADGFQFHESYPWTSKTASGKGVEFIPFTEAVSVTELGNVKTTKGTSVDFESVLKDQGTLDKAVNKYLSNVGMASAAFSVTGEITPEQVEQKKVVADLRKGSKERSRRIQKNYTKAVGKSAGRASAINTNAASIDVFNQDLNLLDIQERSRKINKYAKGNEAGYANNIREKLIDATRKLKEVQKDTEAVGGERSLNQDVINALTLVDPRSAEAVNKFRLSIGLDKVGQGLFKRRAYQKDSLMDRLEKANIDITNLGMILYALHAKEANAYGMMYVDGVLEEMGVPEAAYSGMSDEQANEILVEYGIKTNLKNLQELRDTLGKTNPKLMFALDFMYDVTENTRDTYKKSGMLPGNDKTRVVKRKDKDGKEVTYYQIISAKGTEGSAFLPKDSEAVVIYESKSEQKRDAKLEERLAWANNYEFYVPLKGFAEELEVGTDTPAVEELSLDPVDDADLDKVPDADSRNRVTTKNFLSEVWSKVTAKDQGAEERKERATKQEGIRGKGLEVKDPIRARGGRKGIMAENPALRVLDDHMRAIQNAEKNSVLQKFFNLVTSKDAKELFGDGIKGYKWNPSDKTSETEYNISKDPNKVSVWINGDRHVIEFGQDFSYLAEVITGANQARLVGVVESLGKGTRFISQMLTSYNPGFVPVNLVRDTIMGIYALQGDDVRELIGSQSFAKATATLTGNLPNAWKAIKNVEMGGEIKTPEQKKWADLYKLFKEYGGKTAWVQPLSASEIKEQLNKKLDKVVDGKDTSRGRLMGFLESIEEVNGIFENGSRLSVFAMALENGASPEKAAEVAKNFTVNFNQKGSWGTVLNSLYAFFNAAVQGTAVKTWNLIKSKRGKQIMGSLFALGYFKEMASMFFGGEDDEWIIEYDEKGDPRYRKYSKGEADWAKENSIGQFFGDTWIGVPFAYGLNVFMYAGKRMARLTMDIADDPKDSGSLIAKAVADVTLSTFNSFNPLPIPKSKDSYKGVTRSVVPTVLRYPFDVWANENYFGNSIYPEVQDYMPKDTPAYTLARDNTSRISVNLSKFLNSISNGDQYSKGWINIAPAAIDYIALNYAGGTFKFGQRSVNTLLNTIQAVNKTFEDREGKDSAQLLNSLKENIEDQVKMNQIPIVRSFVRKPNEFVVYDEWLTMQDELKTYSKRYEDNKADPALRQLEGFRKTVTSSKGIMGKTAKQIKKVKEALENLSTLNLSRSVIENRREIYQNRLDSLYEQRNKQQKNLLGIYERIKKRLNK
jgi:hypothetical protein